VVVIPARKPPRGKLVELVFMQTNFACIKTSSNLKFPNNGNVLKYEVVELGFNFAKKESSSGLKNP
jgi:hypothetical protein